MYRWSTFWVTVECRSRQYLGAMLTKTRKKSCGICQAKAYLSRGEGVSEFTISGRPPSCKTAAAKTWDRISLQHFKQYSSLFVSASSASVLFERWISILLFNSVFPFYTLFHISKQGLGFPLVSTWVIISPCGWPGDFMGVVRTYNEHDTSWRN